MKRILGVVVALAMVASVLGAGFSVSAEGNTPAGGGGELVELPGGFWVDADYPTELCMYSGNEKDVVIPSWVMAIWGVRCDYVTSVSIPSSVEFIGSYAFYYACTSLKEINVNADNANYSSVDGVLFSKNKTELVRYPKGKTANTYSIPSSVKTIGEHAFSDCASLTSIYIPTNVTEIGDQWGRSPFDKTTSLKVHAGSYAHQWSIEREHPYVLFSVSSVDNIQDVFDILTVIVNDLSGDSKLTAIDALDALKTVLGL